MNAFSVLFLCLFVSQFVKEIKSTPRRHDSSSSEESSEEMKYRKAIYVTRPVNPNIAELDRNPVKPKPNPVIVETDQAAHKPRPNRFKYPTGLHQVTNSGLGDNAYGEYVVGGHPDHTIQRVNSGVGTILNGVGSGRLSDILRGSFMFTRNDRVRSVANSVLDTLFGRREKQYSANVNGPFLAGL